MIKPTLLMIPGTLCDHNLFNAQIDGLSKEFHCQVVDHSSSEQLEHVASNITNRVEGNFSLMGLSYGGIIAFEIWRQVPHRIESMILLNTNHKPPSSITREKQLKFLGMSAIGEFREITTEFLKDAMLHPDHAQDQKIRNTVLEMALNTGKTKFINQIKAQLNRPDSTQDLPTITCPVLVATGMEDNVCTPEIHREIARLIPNATLELIEHCGHLSTLEQPDKINSLVKDWWLNAKI